jgi:hypothetical protein
MISATDKKNQAARRRHDAQTQLDETVKRMDRRKHEIRQAGQRLDDAKKTLSTLA